MRDYDWGFGFGFGQRYPARPRGYDRGFRGGYDARMQRGGEGGGRGYGRGRQEGGYTGRQNFDRGVYGEGYPAFGGVPGGQRQGMYYGGQQGGREWRGYGVDYPRGGTWGQPGSQIPRGAEAGVRFSYGQGYGQQQRERHGYDQQYSDTQHEDGPFLPESAYRRHPELERQQGHRSNRWQGGGQGMAASQFLDDDEIEQMVRQNLYQDDWIDADAIDVEVTNGVVTLRGEVSDYLEARYAWDDTWETEGVRGVLNQLTVRVDQPSAAAQSLPQSGGGQQGDDTDRGKS
jgi:hypothetical protein